MKEKKIIMDKSSSVELGPNFSRYNRYWQKWINIYHKCDQ